MLPVTRGRGRLRSCPAVHSIDHQTRPTLARGTRLITDKATGQPVLLFPEGVLHLSPTAHAILTRCDGTATTDAIITALADDYDADKDTLRGDVLECLTELHRRKLIVLT